MKVRVYCLIVYVPFDNKLATQLRGRVTSLCRHRHHFRRRNNREINGFTTELDDTRQVSANRENRIYNLAFEMDECAEINYCIYNRLILAFSNSVNNSRT